MLCPCRQISRQGSRVQIPRDICPRFGRYLYSTKCRRIIILKTLHPCKGELTCPARMPCSHAHMFTTCYYMPVLNGISLLAVSFPPPPAKIKRGDHFGAFTGMWSSSAFNRAEGNQLWKPHVIIRLAFFQRKSTIIVTFIIC